VERIPCPFFYANGRRCTGHVVRFEAYKADVDWTLDEKGVWRFSFGPRSHYHLFCSEKGNHAGSLRPDNQQMKFYWQDLPEELQAIIQATDVGEGPASTITGPPAAS
jgi:hypothetical protein